MGEEISRLQNKAREDLERLREEHAAARDREIRALRGRVSPSPRNMPVYPYTRATCSLKVLAYIQLNELAAGRTARPGRRRRRRQVCTGAL
jgi:hypothetical protein